MSQNTMTEIPFITIQGRQLTPAPAVTVFKDRFTTPADRLSILRQLIEKSHEHAAEASDIAVRNENEAESGFSPEVIHLAKQFLANRPFGVKHIESPAQVFEILWDGGTGATFRITFAKQNAADIHQLMCLVPHAVSFQNPDMAALINDAIQPAGTFGDFPLTHKITLVTTSRQEMELVAQGIAATCENIELVSVSIERIGVLQKSILVNMIKEHPHVFYDESVFRQACSKLNRMSEAHIWLRSLNNPNAPMLDIVVNAVVQLVPAVLLPLVETYTDENALR